MFDKKENDKRYYQENIEKIKSYQRWRYINNKERINKLHKIWRENNPEYAKQYHQKHKEKALENYKKYNQEHKKERNESLKNKRKTDLKFNLNKRISSSIRYSLNNNKNGHCWMSLVEYTLNDLIKRLKSTMPKGYSWNDFLRGRLHVDHIVPIDAFNFTQPEHSDFKHCWALDNFQLLPARENLIKGSKLSRPFQPALQI